MSEWRRQQRKMMKRAMRVLRGYTKRVNEAVGEETHMWVSLATMIGRSFISGVRSETAAGPTHPHVAAGPPALHGAGTSPCSRVKICSSEFPPRLQVNRQSVMPHVRAQRDARRPHGAVGSPASVCIRETTSQHCVDERCWAVGLHD